MKYLLPVIFLCAVSVVLPADDNPFYEGQGGAGLRVAVVRPTGIGLPPKEEWLPALVQSTLAADFNKYSAMTVPDRQNLDRILDEQSESLSGNYSESDYIKIGNLTNARYILAGSLTKTDGGFILELSVSDTETGERTASFSPKNCSLDDLQSTAVIKEAVEDLLGQMGVTLTAAGREALRNSISAVPQAASGAAAEADASATITTEKGERLSLIDYLEKTADALYSSGEINGAFSYYKSLSYYFPGYYKGWLGILRYYSGDYTDFDFIDSEVYMERASITAAGNAEREEAEKVRAVFDAQWPGIKAKREQRALEEAKRREDNFHRMAVKREGGTLVEYTRGNTEEVIIPPEITVIGHAAFRQKSGIKRVVLHNNVTAIEREAFQYCTSLVEIVIPASVTGIGVNAFYGCSSLEEIVIPAAVKVIPDNAFYECKNLTRVTIAPGVERIGKAFMGCENLASLIIPRSVTAIDGFAFSRCKNLKTVILLNDSITVGRRAFMGCPLGNREEMIKRFGAEIFN